MGSVGVDTQRVPERIAHADRANVAINGRFLTQRTTGVQRYAREILAATARILTEEPRWAESLAFRLRLPSDAAAEVPDALRFATPVRGRRRGYAWEQTELPRRNEASLNLCNLAPIFGRRNIVCLHDANTYLAPHSYDWKYRAVQRVTMPLLGHTATAVATVSNTSAESLKRFRVVPAGKHITVAPNGHEHALTWQPRAATIDVDAVTTRPFVLMLGSRAPHKNLALVRAIAPDLARRGIDCVVTGQLDGVFAGRAGVDAGIHSIGFVDDNDIALLLSRAVCLLFPSTVEGFGLPIVEAMALGCPVVAADCSCMPEICGGAALLRPPDDARAWIDAIMRLADDPALREGTIRAGRERVRAYSWRDSAMIYLNLLEHVARDPG